MGFFFRLKLDLRFASIIRVQFIFIILFIMKNTKILILLPVLAISALLLWSCSLQKEKEIVETSAAIVNDNPQDISNTTMPVKEEMEKKKMMDVTESEEMAEKEKTEMTSEENMKDDLKTEDKSNETEVIQSDKMLTKKWEYSAYSSDKVTNAEGKIVLFFHADWCPACEAIDKKVNNEEIPEWVTILKVNYDNETELKKKYGVTTQTTFVQVDNEGNKITKWFWARSLDEIIQKLK